MDEEENHVWSLGEGGKTVRHEETDEDRDELQGTTQTCDNCGNMIRESSPQVGCRKCGLNGKMVKFFAYTACVRDGRWRPLVPVRTWRSQDGPKVLDLFCGLGGWSEGFHRHGFDVTGVDIVDVGYPYRLILKDVRDLDGSQFKGYTVIVGSPPCRDYSRMGTVSKVRNWRDPPDPVRGLELVDAFQRIVRDASPKYWIMENVPRLSRYFGPANCFVFMTPTMKRALWGRFPPFLVPMQLSRKRIQDHGGPLRSWLRAKIPICVSESLAQSIVEEEKIHV